MGVGIYGISSWDVVEPMTFMFQAFWLMIGSTVYLRHKIDFSYDGAFDFFKQREVEKLIAQSNFDVHKRDFLESYISEIDAMVKRLS